MRILIKKFNEDFNILKKYLYECNFVYVDAIGNDHSFTYVFTKDELLSAIKYNKVGNDTVKNVRVKRVVVEYPPMTDEKYLKLIAVLNKCLAQGLGTCCLISGTRLKEVKQNILLECMKHRDQIYHEVKEVVYDKEI